MGYDRDRNTQNSQPRKDEYDYHRISFVLHYLEIPFGGQKNVKEARAIKWREGNEVENSKINIESCAHIKELDEQLDHIFESFR